MRGLTLRGLTSQGVLTLRLGPGYGPAMHHPSSQKAPEPVLSGAAALVPPPCAHSSLCPLLPPLPWSLPPQRCTGLHVQEELCSLINLAVSY